MVLADAYAKSHSHSVEDIVRIDLIVWKSE
jgi:hypothetical protein